jgi:hypothetical protein
MSRQKEVNMNKLKQSFKFKKSLVNEVLEAPGKATSEEMLVDCLTVKEQRVLLSLTSSEATNYSTPRALGGGGGKNILENYE